MKSLTIQPSAKPQGELGKPYLKLQLDNQTQIALAMAYTQEVLTIPLERVTPIPNMPSYVIGLLNQRSRIFWLIDVCQMWGWESPLGKRQQYNVAIIRVKNVALGLVIQEIKGVIRLPEEEIESPVGTISPELTPYLQGCILQPEGLLLIIDPNAIINSSV